MPRNISGPMLASLTSNNIRPAILATLTFKSQTVYVWSGIGSIVYAGNTYLGVGSLGRIDRVTEGSDVHAYGTSIALSGIDPTMLGECLGDIRLGAAAVLYFALLDGSGNILGTPYAFFSGVVDKPTITPGLDAITITLALETKLANLSRSSNRRYTSADQALYFAGDSAFNWVEALNDWGLKWTP